MGVAWRSRGAQRFGTGLPERDTSGQRGHGQAIERALAPFGYSALLSTRQAGLVALGVVRGVRAVGLRVPADVAVTGHDGSPGVTFIHPR